MSRPRTAGERDPTIYTSGVVAAVWVVLAWLNPDSTYHLAPVLAAGIFPVAQRLRHGRLAPAHAAGAGAGGYLNVLVVTALLTWLDKLQGPSLLPFGNAAVEALVFGAVGAVVGAALAYAPRPAALTRR